MAPLNTDDDDEDNPENYTLRDLEDGQHSRLLNNSAGSLSASSHITRRVDVPTSLGALLAEKMLGGRLSAWIQGPRPPRLYTITPIGGSIKLAGLRRLRTSFLQPLYRELASLAFFAVLLLSFILVVHTGNLTEVDRTRLSCISRLWYLLLYLLYRLLLTMYLGQTPRPVDSTVYNVFHLTTTLSISSARHTVVMSKSSTRMPLEPKK